MQGSHKPHAQKMKDEKTDLIRLCLDLRREKWIKHYVSRQKILLVGEGDFSFAVCLARAFGSAVNMVATSLDSRKDLARKYGRAISNVEELESLGCTVLHEVDAHTMASDLGLKSFDRIVYNFPHSGFYYRIQEDDEDVISKHQILMRGFFENARSMVAKTGEIHVTHKTGYPYNMWKIVELAEECGLQLVEKARFSIFDYPGYINKRGGSPGGNYRSDLQFPIGRSMTYKFSLACHWVKRTMIDVDTIADEYFQRSITQKPGKRAGVKSLFKAIKHS